MERNRQEYDVELTFNGIKINQVIIDQHYKEAHDESINDLLILELVKSLDGEVFPPEDEKDGFQYFTVEPVIYEKKPYRVILTMFIDNDFLGVINAFRVNL